MKTKALIIKTPHEIPLIGAEGSIAYQYGMSEFYIGKYSTPAGDEVLGLVCYDFKRERWSSCNNGFGQLIEYYIDDARFDHWMHSKANDLDLMFDIFNIIDEEDNVVIN